MRNDSAVTPAAQIVGALYCFLAVGCAAVERAPPQELPEPAIEAAPIPTAEPPPAVATPPAPVEVAEAGAAAAPPAAPADVVSPEPHAMPAPPAAVEPVRPTAPTAVPRAPAPTVAASPPPAPQAAPTKPPAAVTTAPAPAAPIPRAAAVPVPSKPPAPALDLASLKTRLRDTRAIGVFTKLSLKNQVDDLLGQFRAYHKRQSATPLAELRQSYDMLLLKVLSLLQDSDPPLARDIVQSRTAIWGILSNPQKFTEANLMAGATS
jgi:hypothetical protein